MSLVGCVLGAVVTAMIGSGSSPESDTQSTPKDSSYIENSRTNC